MPRKSALYGTLAQYYDQIYHWKDYKKEVRKIKKLILRYKRSSGRDLLDVACGTGKHISLLQGDYDCVGIDSSEQMLAVARRNAPGIELVAGDMLDFNLGRRFDVVLCLFSSIGYLRTRTEVSRAISNFAKHLKNGGVLIIEPWIRKSEWTDRKVDLQTYASSSLKIARVNIGQAKGEFSLVDERYLIAEQGKGIAYIKDRHKMRFFELDSTLGAVRKAGLEPKFTKDSLMPGRGLLIATKPG